MVILIHPVFTVCFYDNLDNFKIQNIRFPFPVFGWCLSAFGIGQLIFWGIYAVYRRSGNSFGDRLMSAFKPKPNWGPADPTILKCYQKYLDELKVAEMFRPNGFWYRIYDNIFG